MSLSIKIRRALFLWFLCTACVTPYEPRIRQSAPRLVIEGLITDQPGPHQVRITQSAAFANGSAGTTPGIGGATVYVTDNEQTHIDFIQVTAGTYRTAADVRGIVGHTYQLHVKLADGRTYASRPDLLRPVPRIDSLYSEYDAGAKKFNVYLDLTDSPTPGEGYFWQWKHYEPLQYCQASERIINPDGTTTQTPCLNCCTQCWAITQCYTCLTIAGDQYVNGNQIRRQLLAVAPYDSRAPYYLLVEQRSLSPAAFRFWQSVKVQSSSTGGPFDAAPAPVVGNVSNVADSGEKVLGFFGASGVITQPYWVDRSNVPANPSLLSPGCPPPPPFPPPPCAPCIEEANYRTQFPPPGWEQ